MNESIFHTFIYDYEIGQAFKSIYDSIAMYA